MDWSDIGLQEQRKAAILRAQLTDALNDVREWQSIARSNEELFYLGEMEECLIFLEIVVAARLSGSKPKAEKQDWDARMGQIVGSYEEAKRVRGQALGYHLSSLVCACIEHTSGVEKEPDDTNDQRHVLGRASKIGENIKRLMKECGWSHEDLADATLIDRKQTIMHANGRAMPRPRTLRKYSQAFTKALGQPITPGDFEK